MRKGLKIAGSTVFAGVYVVMAALLSVIFSVTLCAGFHYIRHLQKLLKELSEK